MKRRFWMRTLLCCALALALCACAAKPAEPEQPDKPDTPPQTESAPTEASEPEVLVRPEVENNGGYFVRVGDKVWFRYYDEGAIDESQLWGNFLAVWPSHPVTSKLCYYDESGDAVNEAFADDGFGPLWFGMDGFYLTRPADNDPKYGGESRPTAYFRSLDGVVTELCDGEVKGVSDNGRFAAVDTWGPSAEGDRLRVYEGTEKIAAVNEGDAYPEFCAVTDDGALLYLDRRDDTLCELAADGSSHVLGALPEPEDSSFGYAWELEQCLVNGDEVWCAFGTYEGTGHFLSDVLCVRALRGTESSLEVVEDQPTTEYPFVPKLYVDAGGEVRRTEHAPGELALSEGTHGNLIVYGENGENMIAENFFPTSAFDGDNAGMIEQTMETVGDAAYLIVADAYRDAENDVGWRMAFTPGELYYLRVPFSGTGVETLFGEEWPMEVMPSAEEVYADLPGTWTLTATEVEGDRSDVLPAGMTETIRFYEDGIRAVIDSFDGESSYYNDFDHAEVLPTNGVSGEAGAYGLLFTSEDTEDMMYAYLEGDTLVATVMMHFQTEYGDDTVSRTGFYVQEAS